MKKIFTIILLFATSFICFAPVFDAAWLMKRIDRQKEIAAMEAKAFHVTKITAVIGFIESRGNYHLTGKDGEIGKYQFMPKTWRKMCKRYAGQYLKPTPGNQDLIAYQYVEHLVDKGYSVSQIASLWNSGRPNCTKVGVTKNGATFDVPKYRAFFVKKYKTIKI